MRTIASRAKINKHKQTGVGQMTLLELLARELKEWPEADFEQGSIESMSQAGDLQVSQYSGVRQVWREDIHDWSGHDYVPCSRFALPELATDHATAIVTRSDWEAEKARIAGKVDGGWIRNRGRSDKCPVADGVKVDYIMRDGEVDCFGRDAENLVWRHHSECGDIMRWKLHKPAEQPAAVSDEVIQVGIDAADAGKLTPIAEVKARYTGSHAGILLGPQPLPWRDRIRTLDTQRAELEAAYQRQIGEIAKERGELVGRLAGEGLALVEVVQPVEDMSDWRNWREGDVLLCEGAKTSHYTNGKLYTFIRISDYRSARCIDDRGIENGLLPQFFKWHSRPAT